MLRFDSSGRSVLHRSHLALSGSAGTFVIPINSVVTKLLKDNFSYQDERSKHTDSKDFPTCRLQKLNQRRPMAKLVD